MTAVLQFTGSLSEHGEPIYLNCDEVGSKELAAATLPMPEAPAPKTPTQPSKPPSPPTIPISKRPYLLPPKTVTDAPEIINLSPVQPKLKLLWALSRNGVKGEAREYGGTLISNLSGDISIIDITRGEEKEVSNTLTVSKDQEIVGFAHTHLDQEGDSDGSLSGGDAGTLINEDEVNMIIAQSKSRQYMFLRTAQTTPKGVDAYAMHVFYENKVHQLQAQRKSFSDASRRIAKNIATKNGLAYYEGSNGIFRKVH
jgi:hypothetical protein